VDKGDRKPDESSPFFEKFPETQGLFRRSPNETVIVDDAF
jgi:hypothetical protein